MKIISIQRKIGNTTLPAIGFGVLRLSANLVGTDEDRLKLILVSTFLIVLNIRGFTDSGCGVRIRVHFLGYSRYLW